MDTLTVDTNVIRDIADEHRPRHDIASKLIALHEAGKCEIRLTTRFDVDVPDGPLRERLKEFKVLAGPPVGTVFRLDYSALGLGDMLASDEQIRTTDQLMELLFPGADRANRRHRNRTADVDHLLGHQISGRDAFLTNDHGILDKREQLQKRFGIVVMDPAEYLATHA